MIIRNNISAIFANRQANIMDARVSKDMEKLSSGVRINSASDDASGLAVSEKMRTQIQGLNQAMKNTQDAISFIQTTEGYLQQVTEAIQRIRELVVQGSNGIYTDQDRGYLMIEIGQLVDEIDRVSETAQFNSMHMLNGIFAKPAPAPASAPSTDTSEETQNNVVVNVGNNPNAEIQDTSTGGLMIQVGPGTNNAVQIFIPKVSAEALGLRDGDGKLTIGTNTQDQANASIGTVDKALNEVIAERTELGAYQNRFESVYQGLYIAYENTIAAESRIRDTNMARAVSDLVRDQILLQASISMIVQANLKPQMILSLLS